MDNHHSHQQEEAFSASLQAFESEILTCLNQFSLSSKSRSDILTLTWIQQCLQLLPSMNKSFRKLILDINYPMNRWEALSVDEYLRVTLKLLDLLNSITSSVSHLGQARMSLSHALSLRGNSPSLEMKAIQPLGSIKNWEGEENEVRTGEAENCSSGKERIVCQAMAVLKVIGFWVCGVVASNLCGDTESCLKLRNSISGFPNSSLMSLHICVCEEMMAKGGLFEVREVNNGVAQLVSVTRGGSNIAVAKELQRRVEKLGKLLEDVEEEVNRIFSEIMLERNDLLASLSQRIQ
ncbi:protein BPS1, chloroplastic-like [Macadamia integrifolia]|uniref:protein BPS1, chloroplastic-like n=1 Tax=Macadamia integrifolia TaxID=60698 RepID=UPI001C4E994F|nr:protein BPS1, chloroplastic-like [Macadamia integrifolia]